MGMKKDKEGFPFPSPPQYTSLKKKKRDYKKKHG
jgi:hypothetical protein